MMDIETEINRLHREGVRFCIASSAAGFVARVGDYLNRPTPSMEVATIEEAVRWVCGFARGSSSVSRVWWPR